MKNQKTIHFIGIGAQKAGTSWLYDSLSQLPEFDLLPIKEIHYFDRSTDYPSPNKLSQTSIFPRLSNSKYRAKAFDSIYLYAKNRNWKLARFYFNYFLSSYSDSWYLSLFKHTDGFTGEITPSYSILNQKDIGRMHKLLPNVRLVFMLRNPIERAWSHYRFNTRNDKGFDPQNIRLEEIKAFLESPAQQLRSNYLRTIENYTQFYSGQILIGFYDAIQDNPTSLLKGILEHICGNKVISIDQLNLSKKVNASRSLDLPKDIHDYLMEMYKDQMKTLANTYGGYFSKWYSESYGSSALPSAEDLKVTQHL